MRTCSLAACGDDTTGPGGKQVLTTLAQVAGDRQTDTATRELDEAVVVRALDQDGRAMEGILVSFVVIGGSGSTFSGYALSDMSGEALDLWRLGEAAGPQTLEARWRGRGRDRRRSRWPPGR